MNNLNEVRECGNQISQEVKELTNEEQIEMLKLIDMYKFCKNNLFKRNVS